MGLIDGVLNANDTNRKALLERTHPVYDQYVTDWSVALDAYDGAGGFLNGGYLWRFPREDDEQFARRKRQARYQNYAETLVDIYVRQITEGITRTSRSEDLLSWWDDVDGSGTPMTDYIGSVLGQALASGHAGILVDKAADLPSGPSRADDPNLPYLQTFTSVAMTDWRLDRRGLAAVKLRESAAASDMGSQASKDGWLLWDRDRWARFDAGGAPIAQGEPGLGVVPLLTLRPKPSRRHPFIGKPLVTPSLIQAMYNRSSEEDLVLRDQAFSLFLVEVPTDAQPEDIQQAKAMLAGGVGTTTVAVIKGNADFRTADMKVPETLRASQRELVHEMFRMAHLRFQRDSLQEQSAEAMRLQRVDLDSAFRSIAETLQSIERQIAWLFFAWTAADPDRAFESARVEVVYPSDFSIINIEEELTAISAALALNLGDTASRELRKRAVTLALPDLSDDTLEAVRAEIDASSSGLSSGAASLREQAAERLRAAGVDVTEAA